MLGANQWASDDLVANNLRDPFDGALTEYTLYGTTFDQIQVQSLAPQPASADDLLL